MRNFLIILGIVMSCKIAAQNNIGPGNCLDFGANISNANHVDLGNLSLLNTGDFSFECWMKVNAVMDDEAFFSNKNWVSGNNTGFVFDVQDNGTNMKFSFKDDTNPRKDLTVQVDELSRDWYHFAGTFKRGGYFVVYINGVAKDSIDVSSITSSFLSAYTYKLGQDGTGDYSWTGYPRFNGKLDDVRIWSHVRTKQQIRDNMCHKLTGSESGLYAYYDCNETSGTVLNDLTPNNNDGTLVNCINSNWTVSGAPIGDESTNMYAGNFGSNSIQIANATYGDFTVKNISVTAGIHLYRVSNAPGNMQGLNNLSGNNNYYGVFVTDTNQTVSYDVEYNYSNYTVATADESNLVFFNRVKNDGLYWSDYFAAQNTTNNTLTKTGLNYRKEFATGTKTGISCNAPYNLQLVSSTTTSATIGWTSGGASHFNIQWGVQGFIPGTGTVMTNSTNNPVTISGLASNTMYDLYVQDTCTGSGSSYWVGPFTFYGEVCLMPTALNAVNISYNTATLSWTSASVTAFDVEWGLPGFAQGTGIPVTGVTNPYLLTGLAPSTTYSYYVRGNCGTNNYSPYNGPYTFTTTLNTSGVAENGEINPVTISPNPAKDFITVQFNEKVENAVITVVNVFGNKITDEIIVNGSSASETIDLSSNARGIYFVTIKNGKSTIVKKLILN